ncbi:hypothetical protein BED47_07770 [Gottfriedia luciferensis]|uniref:Uncharacterized protein n=1 Tax=Gottfriedia luciferensis TaxID=178774 RepID=A0ABX2ZQQ9_9BACI|nr:hypothetical protein BED47_07770 [Gottfriedia luciferensis]
MERFDRLTSENCTKIITLLTEIVERKLLNDGIVGIVYNIDKIEMVSALWKKCCYLLAGRVDEYDSDQKCK